MFIVGILIISGTIFSADYYNKYITQRVTQQLVEGDMDEYYKALLNQPTFNIIYYVVMFIGGTVTLAGIFGENKRRYYKTTQNNNKNIWDGR